MGSGDVKIMSRKEAKLSGETYYYDGKSCKWDHDTVRVTATGLCEECAAIMEEHGMVGETFESIMKSWESTSHKEGTKRLPYLTGTSNMGYKVRGFTYVSEDWYESCSKLLWIKVKNYIKCSLSKGNCKRAGKNYTGGRNYIFLHRFIKGLGDSSMIPDHINGLGLDNRSGNLRVATRVNNSHNSKKRTKAFSTYKGVTFLPSKGKRIKEWRGRLSRFNRDHVKFFKTEREAAEFYDSTLRLLFPSCFNLYNFPEESEQSV